MKSMMHLRGFRELGKKVHERIFGKPPEPAPLPDLPPVEHVLHLRWTKCDTCGGKGSHVNPSIDAHGISSDEFDEDPEFEESYHQGMYDVTCYECKGRGLSLHIDQGRTKKEAMAAAEEFFESEESYRSECEAERRMGA